MTALGDRIAAEALALVGTPFRLQGRDTRCGLDCVGLVALVLQRARHGARVDAPLGYRLRNSQIERYLPFAHRAGLAIAAGPVLAGDILHGRAGPGQDHLMVAVGSGGCVHAHASVGRVVATPGPFCGPVLHHWRAF